jgi:hypothetical protein
MRVERKSRGKMPVESKISRYESQQYVLERDKVVRGGNVENALVREAQEAIETSASDEGWKVTRVNAERAFRFYDGDQWDQQVKARREAAGRPCLTIPKIRTFVNVTMGEWRQNRSTGKVRPVDNLADPQTAKVFEGLLRDIEYQSAADLAYQNGLKHGVIGGFGWTRVILDNAPGEVWNRVIKIKKVKNPFAVYPDPQSCEYDLSDARYLIFTEWMPRTTFEKRFPKAAPASVSEGLGGDIEWVNSSEDMVRVAEFWWREAYKQDMALVRDDLGQMHQIDLNLEKDPAWVEYLEQSGAILQRAKVDAWKIKMSLVSGSDVLYGPIDWPGMMLPFAPFYGEDSLVGGHIRWSGIVHPAMDTQRMYNLWRSRATEVLGLQPNVPWVGPKGFMGTGHQKQAWEQSHMNNVAALEYDTDEAPKREAPPAYPHAMNTESEVVTGDMREVVGLHQPSLGEREGDQSGRAIRALQQQGSAATSVYPENTKWGIQVTSKIVIELFAHVYDTPRIVRTLGEDRETVELAGINGVRLPGLNGQIVTHDFTKGKYDVVVTTGPTYATRRMEAFDAMLGFIGQLPPEMQAIVLPPMLRNADWPGAEEMADAIEQSGGQGQLSPEFAQQLHQIVAQVVQQAIPSPDQLQQMIIETMQQEHQRLGIGGPQRQLPPGRGR